MLCSVMCLRPVPAFIQSKSGGTNDSSEKKKTVQTNNTSTRAACTYKRMPCLSFGHIFASVKMTLSTKKSNVNTVDKLFQQTKVLSLICFITGPQSHH